MSDVIRVDFANPPAFTVKRKRDEPCRHDQKEVSERGRVVVCSACDEQLDPIEVILDFADGWDRYNTRLENANTELRRKYVELAEIKRELRNAKASLRRVRQKGARWPTTF